jgi:1-phosphatidylinositol phosphodiesterase
MMHILATIILAWCCVSAWATLADFALEKVLRDAAPVFGIYNTSTSTNTNTNTSEWMKKIPDDTPIVRMNIPGTHDSATWNYSLATQQALEGITSGINGEVVPPPEYLRCQDRSPVDMLNAGIRAFDLRYAFDATNSTIVFYHGAALVSETATLDDLLFGFYRWLDDHPSEAVFLSLQYEGGTTQYAANNAAVQQALLNILTSDHARHYFLQTQNEFGTLGQARGKITLLRRFDLDQLPASASASLPGIHFSPSLWTDNTSDITLVYNEQKNLTAYIEDYYQPLTPQGSTAALNIQWKYNATTANLLRAASDDHPDSLYWSFASSENTVNLPPEYPRIMALGNGTQWTPDGGVNQRLVPFLQGLKGKRVGIVMFDFYEEPEDLVETLLSL